MAEKKIMTEKVVSVRKSAGQLPYDLYIGRANVWTGHKQSKWANPFSVPKYGREKCLELYEAYIRRTPRLMNALEELRGKNTWMLVCAREVSW